MEANPNQENKLIEEIRKAALEAGSKHYLKRQPMTENWPTEPEIKDILIEKGRRGEAAQAVWGILTEGLSEEDRETILLLLDAKELPGVWKLAWGEFQPTGKNLRASFKQYQLKRWVAQVARRAYLRERGQNQTIKTRWLQSTTIRQPLDEYIEHRIGTQSPELKLLVKTEATWKMTLEQPIEDESSSDNPGGPSKPAIENFILFPKERKAEEKEFDGLPQNEEKPSQGYAEVPEEELPSKAAQAKANEILQEIEDACHILSNTENWAEKSPTNWPNEKDIEHITDFLARTYQSGEESDLKKIKKHLRETLHKGTPKLVYRATQENEAQNPWLAKNGMVWVAEIAEKTSTPEKTLNVAVKALAIKQALSVMPLTGKDNKTTAEYLEQVKLWVELATGKNMGDTLPGKIVTYLKIWRSLEATKNEAAKPKIIWTTKPQKEAIQRLDQHFLIWKENRGIGGFSLRPPLLVGSSGSGKNTIIRALASLHNSPCLILNAPNWQLMSARSGQYTLADIAVFLGHHKKTIIAIDEIDKVGNGNNGDAGGWYRGVRSEVMGFIEKQIDGYCPERWTEEIRTRFRENCFLIVSGTWQKVFRPTWEGSNGNSIQGGIHDSAPTFEELLNANLIPEELLARTANPIFLQPPGKVEFLDILTRIHNGRKPLPQKEKEHLAEEAVASGKNMRWAEDYAEKMLILETPTIEIPDAIGIKENPPEDPKEVEED